MGRLIDADRLKYHYCWWEGGDREMTIDEAKKTFDTIIDLQPEAVVHCKDCKYWGLTVKWDDNTRADCLHFPEHTTPSDGYCYLGEKKDE